MANLRRRRSDALRIVLSVAVLLSWSIAGCAEPHSQTAQTTAVNAILDAFSTHELVALGESHGIVQISDFRLALIQDARFPEVVDDVVVEFGNSIHQDLADQFVSGSHIEREELVRIWQDTGLPFGLWDVPVYEEVFQAVRAVNVRRPKAKHVRILLGDPPLDWDQVRSSRELQEWGKRRDTFPAELIQREVLRKDRKALILYGAWHTARVSYVSREGRVAEPLVALLERQPGARVFTIDLSANVGEDVVTIDPYIGSLPSPSLVILAGTRLGSSVSEGLAEWSATPLPRQRLYDAFIYLGPRSMMRQSNLEPEWTGSPYYHDMRMGRAFLSRLPASCVPE